MRNPTASEAARQQATREPPSSILIVEDEAVVALDLKMELESLGYRVVGIADTAAAAVEAARRLRPSLTLMDIVLKGEGDGIQAAESLSGEPALPVIFLTSFSDAATVQRAAQASAYGYLTKPFQIKELRAGIEVALWKSRMEQQRREADRWFASTLRSVHDGLVVVDTAATVRFMNGAAERLTGWRLDEAAGRAIEAVVRFAPAGGDDPASSVRLALQAGQVIGVRHARRLQPRFGVPLFVDESAAPIHDALGSRLGGVLVLRQGSEPPAHAKASCGDGNLPHCSRGQFLSRVSHEMRTPLNAVLGFAELLQQRHAGETPAIGTYSGHILDAGRHLLALVDDVLDLQRAGDGTLRLRMAAVPLDSELPAAIGLLQPAAAARRIALSESIAPGLWARVDAMRLRQVLLNLGSNAIKYNLPGGRVHFSAGPAAAAGRIRIGVDDSGIGMSADQLAHLFEPFNRLGREGLAVPGVGLGLVITRQLVEQMGGTLAISSSSAGGTRVELDFAAAEVTARPAQPAQPLLDQRPELPESLPSPSPSPSPLPLPLLSPPPPPPAAASQSFGAPTLRSHPEASAAAAAGVSTHTATPR